MSIIRINHLQRLNTFIIRKNYNYSSLATPQNDEYTATPNYPPILDLSPLKNLERKKEAIYEEIKAVKTVEEKQIKLNMPRYYGFKCYKFAENFVPYDNLNLAQHITRTHLIQSETLPEYYNDLNVDPYIKNVKSSVEDALELEIEGYKEMIDKKDLSAEQLENLTTSKICRHINRVLMNNLSQDFGHLVDVQVDYEPRLESFWFVGGMIPPKNVKRMRENMMKEKKVQNDDDPTDRAMQYNGFPVLTLRSSMPLKSLIAHETANSEDFKVPFYRYDPRAVGTKTNHQHGVNIPGFWPGDSHKFGLVSYHNRGHLIDRSFNDTQEALDVQGILSSYAWLNAQANYLGFTTFNEITYPLVTQTIITNGKLWSFYSYQLNTLLMYGKHINENQRVNVCWSTPEQKLYETVENGKLVGFNEDVLRKIVKMYCNAPQERLGVNMTPYLSQEEKIVADYEDEDKRKWLEKEYKHIVCNKPKHRLQFELYHWEKIYKVDFQTRPLEKRMRPFELKQNPFKRTLDDRFPGYIPKIFRPNSKRYKERFAKTYYP